MTLREQYKAETGEDAEETYTHTDKWGERPVELSRPTEDYTCWLEEKLESNTKSPSRSEA